MNRYLQLNMEVELELGQIPNLKEFISHLTQTMHSSLPGSLVIWWVIGNPIHFIV
jgi:mannosyl-glycoprotein endo-beta-N-acetylglucosaminidase